MEEYRRLIERQKTELDSVKARHRKEMQNLRLKHETQRFEMRKRKILIPEFMEYIMDYD